MGFEFAILRREDGGVA